MPSLFDKIYRWSKGTLLVPEEFNKRFRSIDERFLPLEERRFSEDLVLTAVQDRVLTRSEAVIAGLRDRLVAITQLQWLTGNSSTARTLVVDTEVSFVLDEADRALFAPGPYAVVSSAADPTGYAIVRTIGYSAEVGQYDCRVEVLSGLAGLRSDWTLAAVAGSTLAQRALLDQGKVALTDALAARSAAQGSAASAAGSASAAAVSAGAAADKASAAAGSASDARASKDAAASSAATATSKASEAVAAPNRNALGPVASVNGRAGVVMLDPLAVADVFPSLDLVLTSSDAVQPAWFARASSAYRRRASGLLENVAANVLRIDHDATGQPIGSAIEEARTNLLLNSLDPAAGNWGLGSNASFQGLTTAPDGTNTARIIRLGSGGNAFSNQLVAVTANVTYTMSGYYRLVSGDVTGGGLLLSNTLGAAGSVPRTQLTTSWKRVSLTVTPTSSGNFSFNALYDLGAVDVAVWGFQLEAGALPTAYVPTTTASASRAADSLVVPATADWLNAAEGTFYFDGYAPPAYGTSSAYLFDLNDGSQNTRILARLTSAGVLGVLLFSGGSGLPGVSLGTVAAGAPIRLAAALKAGSLVASLNGAAPVSSAPASVPSGLTSLVVGNIAGGTGAALNAPVRRLAYVPRALPDALLPRMTA